MMHFNKLIARTLVCGLLASTAISAPAFAQAAQDGADQDSSSADIVVTARLRSERLQDVPVAITALPSETLERYSVSSISDMSTFVPGMVVGRQVTGSSASIFLRGIGSTSLSAGFDQSVSFSIDGLPMSRGREILFSQYDIEQVEVLKGPQALFFGRNTTGGLINITTKGPTSNFEAGIKGAYGFEGKEWYTEGYVSGPLSDTLRARVAFRANDSQGVFKNTAPATSVDPATGFTRLRVDDRRGANNAISGRGTLEWEPSSNFQATLKAGFTNYEDNGAGDLYERICGGGRTVPAATSGFADPAADCVADGRSPHSTLAREVAGSPGLRNSRDGRPYTDLKTRYALANLQYNLDGVNLTSITAYYRFKQQDLNDFNGSTRTVYTAQQATFKQFSQELRLQTESSGPLNVTSGIFFASSKFDLEFDAYLFGGAADSAGRYVTNSRDNGFDGKTLSAFAEFSYEPMPELVLTGGARYSFDQKDSFQRALPGHSSFWAAFPPTYAVRDRYRESNISPQATITYKPSRDISIYGAYKQGYKAGGFNLSQTQSPTATVATGRFTSETAEGWEGGFKSLLWDRNLRFNLTGYHYTYSDLQVQFYNPVTAGTVVANAGELVIKGIEADFNLKVPGMTALSLHGSVAYNDAKYKNFIGSCFGGQTVAQGCNLLPNATNTAFNGQNYSGRTPPKAPKWGAQFGASVEQELGSNMLFTLTGDATHTSAYNYTDTLRPDAIQRAVTRFDATASISGNDDLWKLSLIGRNLTNKYVVTSANDMSFTGGTGTGTAAGVVTDLNAQIDRPREIYLELSLKF